MRVAWGDVGRRPVRPAACCPGIEPTRARARAIRKPACYPKMAPTEFGRESVNPLSPMTESPARVRAERAHRWRGAWSHPGPSRCGPPSGRSPVAAQQPAESFVADHVAVLRWLGGARGEHVLSGNGAGQVWARIGRSDRADDRIGDPSERRAGRPVARIGDLRRRSSMGLAVRPSAGSCAAARRAVRRRPRRRPSVARRRSE